MASILKSGRQSLTVLCGAFGERGMLGAFEGCESSVVDLKPIIPQSLFEWMTTSGLFSFQFI
jgi:hypothetical protein